jgi:hypothetical protein
MDRPRLARVEWEREEQYRGGRHPMARIKPVVFAAALTLGASPAFALTIIPNPVSLNASGIVRSIELVDVVTGLPVGGVVGDGSVGASDTTLVFQATVVESSPFDAWGFIVLGLRLVGGSSFIAPTASGGIDPDSNLDEGDIRADNSVLFLGTVDEGTTSDRFFVSYASPLATDGSLELLFVAGEAVNLVQGVALIVPEPGTVLLLTLAKALTAARSMRPWRGGRTSGR